MRNIRTDVLVIGGGAGGMAAAVSAAKEGAHVILLEREDTIGGVLNQCIHNGFGLQFYQQELTGPEFSYKLENELKEKDVHVVCGSYVRHVDFASSTAYVLSSSGVQKIEAGAIVIATGARERPFGALLIPGDRPAGILPAGLAQRYVNLENHLPGKRALILGSGDIGLIMARRLTLEGMEVVAVVERMPYPGGLTRNVVQCLEDFGIPLHLSHTVTQVRGKGRLERVEVSQVDKEFNPVPGTAKHFDVDTLILSAGLIPHIEDYVRDLSTDHVNKGLSVSNTCETTVRGTFAAGNNVAIFDLVDYVAAEGWIAGRHAAFRALGKARESERIPVVRKGMVGALVPNMVDPQEHLRIYLRVKTPMDKGKIVLEELGIEKDFVYAVPSEMIQLVVNRDKFEKMNGADSLTVEVLP